MIEGIGTGQWPTSMITGHIWVLESASAFPMMWQAGCSETMQIWKVIWMADIRILRAEKDGSDQPPAFVKAHGDSIEEIAYPSGERATGRAAGILFAQDLKPVCSFTEVDVDGTPFEGDLDV